MSTIYKQSMALQAHLDTVPETDSSKQAIARMGLELINERWDGSLTRAAHTSAAYFIDDGLTTESLLYPTQKFGEVILKGTIPRIACVDVSDRLVVSLPFFDAVVLGPVQEVESELVAYEMEECATVLSLGTRIARPLYTPVENLSFITFAA